MFSLIDLSFVDFDVAAAATTVLVAPVAGKRVYVLRFIANTFTPLDFSLVDSAAALCMKEFTLGTRGGLILGLSAQPWCKTPTALGLNLLTDSAARITGRLWYIQKA